MLQFCMPTRSIQIVVGSLVAAINVITLFITQKEVLPQPPVLNVNVLEEKRVSVGDFFSLPKVSKFVDGSLVAVSSLVPVPAYKCPADDRDVSRSTHGRRKISEEFRDGRSAMAGNVKLRMDCGIQLYLFPSDV